GSVPNPHNGDHLEVARPRSSASTCFHSFSLLQRFSPRRFHDEGMEISQSCGPDSRWIYDLLDADKSGAKKILNRIGSDKQSQSRQILTRKTRLLLYGHNLLGCTITAIVCLIR